jgi:membrane protease YdiL (CAAX protease family)
VGDGRGEEEPPGPGTYEPTTLPPPPPGTWAPPPEWSPPVVPQPVPPPPGWVPSQPELLATSIVTLEPNTRRSLVTETRVVMIAFLVPSVLAAVALLAKQVNGVGPVTRFPSLAHNQLANMIIGILVYLAVAAVVPLALYLLSRTGQRPRDLGINLPSFRKDVWPAAGLIAASLGSNFALAIVLAPLLLKNSHLLSNNAVGQVPHYYVIYGIAVSATTAVAEEVLINGYLLVRLEQLGWPKGKALALSLALRTSYHVYYGIGFVLTVPFGYFVTRSFQKNRRLMRPIVTHFLYDAILFTIAILAS